jgi:hypothetical protein
LQPESQPRPERQRIFSAFKAFDAGQTAALSASAEGRQEANMIWFVIVAVIAIVGGSVVAGLALQSKRNKARKLSRREQVTLAKAAGAFPHRKES